MRGALWRLQWGRDVSVADVVNAQITSRKSSGKLQWGRDVSVADVNAAATIPLVLRYASMGPRRFRRGCMQRVRHRSYPRACFNGAATFPSRMSRYGRPREPGTRCFNGAATFPSRMFQRVESCSTIRQVRLQWGRDVSVADVVNGVGGFSNPNLRFNGAATFPSRMSLRWGGSS